MAVALIFFGLLNYLKMGQKIVFTKRVQRWVQSPVLDREKAMNFPPLPTAGKKSVVRVPSHLYRKHNCYYFRFAIPRKFRETVERTEIHLSLKTAYLREAAARSATLAKMLITLVESSTMLKYNEIKRRCNKLLAEIIETQGAQLLPMEMNLPFFEGPVTTSRLLELLDNSFKIPAYHEMLALGKMPESNAETPLSLSHKRQVISQKVYECIAAEYQDKLVAEGIFSEDEFSANKAVIGKCMAQLEQARLKFVKADEEGDYEASFALENLISGGAKVKPQVENKPTLLLSEAMNKYFSVKIKDNAWKQTTIADVKTRVGTLIEVIADQPLAAITRDKLRDFRDILVQLPPNRQSAKYKGKSIKAILELRPEKIISIATVNVALEAIGSFFKWCVQEQLLAQNPATGLQIKDTRQAITLREAFTIDDLRLVFKHPKFSGGKFKNPAYFWIPLISLFSGMRLEEIAQLYCNDIYEDKPGIWVFDVNERGKDEKGIWRPLRSKIYLKRLIYFIKQHILSSCFDMEESHGAQTGYLWSGRFICGT